MNGIKATLHWCIGASTNWKGPAYESFNHPLKKRLLPTAMCTAVGTKEMKVD